MRPVEIVRLTRRDTVGSICQRLYQIPPGTRVWLVTPWRLGATRSMLNLRRVVRAAENTALELRLVSRHVQTRLLAREAGIPAFLLAPPNLWVRWTADAATSPRPRRAPRRARPYLKQRRHFGFGAFLLSLVIVAVLLAVLAGSILLLLPSATVTLHPQAQTSRARAHVTASLIHKETDYGQAIVPARLVQVIIEGRGETPATEGLDVSDEHASGEVVFANRTDESVVVPKGTIVRTTSGVSARLYTVSDVELPAVLYGHARVGVIAVDPGIGGNVKPFTINVVEGDVADQVDVLNDKPTEGGTTRRVPMVAFRDFDRLRADMIARLQEQAYEQLVAELDKDEFIPPESLDVQVMAQHFDQVVDQQSNVLSMDMKVVARGIAVDGGAVEDLARRLLQAGTGDIELIEDSLVVERSEQVEIRGSQVIFDFAAHGAVAPRIDGQEIKTAILGMPASRAAEWLAANIELASDPTVEVSPSMWGRMPMLTARIKLIVSVESD